MTRDYSLDPMIMAIYTATAPVDDPMHWEDECTLQFGVEDDDVQHRRLGSGINAGGVIFREYGGEDFSKYLDDDEVPAVPLAVTTGSAQLLEEPNKPSANRYQKRQSRKRPDEASTMGVFDQMESPYDSSSTPGSKKSVRERLVQLLPGSSKTHRSKSREVKNKIQNCSFTDLRIGSSLLSEQQRLSAGSSIAGSSAANATSVQRESDSSSEIRSSISLETRSDLGFRGQSSSWWNLDTLSDRQGTSVIEANGRQKTRNPGTSKFQRRAESVPDLLDSREGFEGGPHGQRSPVDSGSYVSRVSQRRHLGSVNGGLVNCWDEDVRRQAEQSTPPKPAPGHSIWKRLTHSINKRTRRSKGFDGGKRQQLPPANDLRPTQINQQRHPANAMRPPPTPPPNSWDNTDIYDEIRL